VTGRICEVESAACLAEHLLALFDDPGLRGSYGEAALQQFEAHYSPEIVRERWLRLLYDNATAPARSAARAVHHGRSEKP
jgi:glycosyltransferase involved in cell wall biosynthesis